MEPPSPIEALGVNPFPSRFLIRTVPSWGDFARRRWEEPITTTKGPTIRNVMGGRGIFERQEFFFVMKFLV